MATMIITFSSALFLFFLFSFLSIKTLSQPRVNHLRTFCNNSSDSFTKKSSYDLNRTDALRYLRTSTSTPTYLSVSKGLSPDEVYAMYHCRGDITKSICRRCVRTAISEISESCTYQREAFIFYEECMVRYSDYSFVGALEGPYSLISSPINFSTTSQFGEILSGEMGKLITRAASTTLWPEPYFLESKQRVTELGSSYDFDSVVQCSPDLDSRNCTVCLRLGLEMILDCCSRSRSAQNFLPKCLVKFNTSSLPLNVPSLGVIKGNKVFGRILIAAIAASVLALVGL